MNKRFQVSERVGCAAVIDTLWPNIGNGLTQDDPWVMEYSSLPREDCDERNQTLYLLKFIASQYNETNKFSQKHLDTLRDNLTNAANELAEVFAHNRNFSLRNLKDLTY